MSDWLPSLNALRAFETVSRHLNYRLAAEELGVTPAAVKQLVGKLEDTLGIPLVERSGRGLTLTSAGEAGRDGLSVAFSQIQNAVENMKTTDGRRRLIVSVEPSFATAWLVPRLESFRAGNAEIDVLIDSSLHIVDLDRGAADIAIRFGNAPGGALVAHRLFDEELCAFCSPALKEGRPGPMKLEDLETLTLLHWDLSQMDWASATRKWMGWTQWLERVGAGQVTQGEGVRFRDYNLAVQAAIAGQGVILGSLPVLCGLVEAGLLVVAFPERVVTDIGYDLVTTDTALARHEVARFVDWILEEARL